MWSRLICRAPAPVSVSISTLSPSSSPFRSFVSVCHRSGSGSVSVRRGVNLNPSRSRSLGRSLSTLSTSIPHASSGCGSAGFSVFIDPPKICTIVGAPLADGQPLVGVDKGPEYIRSQGCRRKLEADGWLVEDRGDLDFASLKHLHYAAGKDPNIKARQAPLVGAANRMLYQSVVEEARKNKFCLQLGGDHSIGIGSIAAVLKAHPDATIIWVDAHADINTPNGSASGNIHGMVVSFLMDLENSRKTGGFEWMSEVPLLKPSQLVYIGLRDLDAPEKQIIKQLGIKAFTMHEVDRYGIGEVMARAIDHITARAVRPIHLTFDIDSVDPLYAPSTGTRVAGGLTYREAYYICEAAAATGMLTSMDLVEVNPQLAGPEGSDMTVSMAVGLISSALGNKIL